MANIFILAGLSPGADRRRRENIGRSEKVAREVEKKQCDVSAIAARRVGGQTLPRDCFGELEWLVQGGKVR